MPFPISIAGTISVSKDEISLKSTEETLVRIEDMLDTAAARTVTREGASIKFKGIYTFNNPNHLWTQ
jgi:hypothetical protein